MAPKTSKSFHSVRSDHQTSEIWTRPLVRPSIWAPMQMSARISDRRNRKLSGFRSANDRTSRSRINANKRPSQPPFEHVSNAPTKVVAEEEGGGRQRKVRRNEHSESYESQILHEPDYFREHCEDVEGWNWLMLEICRGAFSGDSAALCLRNDWKERESVQGILSRIFGGSRGKA